MPITFNEKSKVFTVSTPHSGYVMALLPGGALAHVHYGGSVAEIEDVSSIYRYSQRVMEARDIEGGSTDNAAMEYPTFGNADLRRCALHAHYADGTRQSALRYVSHSIFKGKKALSGLPAAYVEKDDEADTLEIVLESAHLRVTLTYCAYRALDAICTNARIENISRQSVELREALSVAFDFSSADFDMVTLPGEWARERHTERVPLGKRAAIIDSRRGASGPRQSPFFALCSKDANETAGDVYGFALVYSGNFIAGAEVDSYESTRVFMGINTFDFEYTLASGESFQTPEAICVYSDAGFGAMSRTFHRLCRTRICRGKWRDTPRSVLINNWEATYFNFNEEKILDIAREAKDLGVELMVLDDGWFGQRDNDCTSLGDWWADEKKLPHGIDGLCERVNALGMKFGLWFEPEMVSPKSRLYEAHPDWCLHDGDNPRYESRNQLVLDLSRPEVCEHVYKSVADILRTANVEYVKWDMNRHMTATHAQTAYRYMLGLYGVMERLTSEFPNVLFEGCSSGGGRFDFGMLYYMPQFWTSDDTDAAERMKIQHGTSLFCPPSAISAHVSAVPNHQVGRVSSIETRGAVAMCGRFGYEMDLATLTDDEKSAVREQIKLYKKIEDIVHQGDMYRLASPFEGNITAWEFVSERGAVLFLGNTLALPNPPVRHIRLSALDKEAYYEARGVRYRGDVLMNIGILFEERRDFSGELMFFEKL